MSKDIIYRQDAIDLFDVPDADGMFTSCGHAMRELRELPSAQPEAIPVEWIDKHLEWLDNCDNDFAQLAKVSIRAMVELWKKDKI